MKELNVEYSSQTNKNEMLQLFKVCVWNAFWP